MIRSRGLNHIQLNVRNLARSVAFYEKAFGLKVKFRIGRSMVTRAGGKLINRGEHAPGVEYAYISDPDGYVIELQG
jgi:catechol 2,3-dioxygenase-like lactoylglutathione lyase family enzyme